MNCWVVLALLACALAGVHSHQENITCLWFDCNEPCDGGSRQCNRTNGNIWYHFCNTHSCDHYDNCGKSDFVYVLDSSNSIGDKFYWMLKQWTIDVIKGMLIGAFETRVACVTYSYTATTRWGLTEKLNEGAVEEGLWTLPWEQGTTNTYDGLRKAEDIIQIDGRTGVSSIVVLVTDGESNIQANETIPQAHKMHAAGITIFSIGIGNEINEDELYAIASEPKANHFFLLRDYTALDKITNAVINDTCDTGNINSTVCGNWSDWTSCQDVVDNGTHCFGVERRWQLCILYPWIGDSTEIWSNETRICEEECDDGSPDDPCIDDTGCGLFPSEKNCEVFGRCVSMCECIVGNTTGGPDPDFNAKCKKDPLLHFPFHHTINDVSCNAAEGKKTSGVSLLEGAAYFDGSGWIEVRFLEDYFTNEPTSAMTLSLWYHGTGGLVCNTGCGDGGSFELAVTDKEVTAKLVTSSLATLASQAAYTDDWNHIALVYSGISVQYYINGRMIGEEPISGSLANTYCPMTIGSCSDSNFIGFIDDVRVYRRMLYDEDVVDLFNSGMA